jgi:small subunit ribosomal protein S18
MAHTKCWFCKKNIREIDYKDSNIGRYLTNWGKIKPGSDSGVCSRHQRRLSEAIKRARFLALLSYTKR